MKRRTTMKDVAEYARVSTATVGRYLHQNGYISEEAAQRIQKAIEATGYNLNVVAQNLRQQRTNIIGHIIQSIAPNPFFAQVALGAEQYARQCGYNVLTINVQDDIATENKAIETFLARRVDVLIFTAPLNEENVITAAKTGIPVVQVERPRTTAAHSVMVDNYSGAVAAMQHLIDLGHQRIGFIGAELEETLNRYVERERLAGYYDQLAQHGIPVDERLIRLGVHYRTENGGSAGDGYQLAQELLALDELPTAIFATSDMLASGVCQAVYEHGLRIPDDISIVGFDDTLAEYLSPPLTTVRLPMPELGMTAVRIALDVLQQCDTHVSSIRTERLPTRLIVRQSTATIKG